MSNELAEHWEKTAGDREMERVKACAERDDLRGHYEDMKDGYVQVVAERNAATDRADALAATLRDVRVAFDEVQESQRGPPQDGVPESIATAHLFASLMIIDWAGILDRSPDTSAAQAKRTEDEPQRFRCVECNAFPVKVDEDACCVSCGVDCEVWERIYAPPTDADPTPDPAPEGVTVLTPERIEEILDESMRGKADLHRYLNGGETTGELDPVRKATPAASRALCEGIDEETGVRCRMAQDHPGLCWSYKDG